MPVSAARTGQAATVTGWVFPIRHMSNWRRSQAYPERPVETAKAWKEMVHRYFAGTLGLLILGIFLLRLARRIPRRTRSPALPTLLLASWRCRLRWECGP